MRRFSRSIAWLLAVIWLLAIERADADEAPVSGRIQLLRREVAEHGAAAVEQFWKEVDSKCPLVEPIEGDAEHSLVTFLWRNDASVERVEVRGGPFATSREPLVLLGDSDVLYRSERLPNDARYVYGIMVWKWVDAEQPDGTVKRVLEQQYPTDSRNPRQFNDGPVVELPDAPKDSSYVARESVAKGLVEQFSIESTALMEGRRLSCYVPHAFDPGAPHALALFMDGEECEKLMNMPIVFDNLIAEGRIPPTVVVMVHAQGTRGRDLVFSDPFVTFLADELTPHVVNKFDLQVTPKETLVGGMSLGGLTAAYAAQNRPDVFGKVLSQSGAFWRARPDEDAESGEHGWFLDHVKDSKRNTVRYYLEVGRFESEAMIQNNQLLRDELRAKGNDVTYHEYNGGHDHVNWRVSVGQGVTALLGN